MTTKIKTEWRIDRDWPSKLMVKADGYVMVRRPGCIPYVMWEKDWEKLPMTKPPSITGQRQR